jgi:iron(III) transport system substrate-binding protein
MLRTARMWASNDPHCRTTPLLVALLLMVLPACQRQPAGPPASQPASSPGTVVVYTSVDERFAREILDRFEQRTQIAVEMLTDTEAGKTTGFLRRLERETVRPRCDVWWSSEIFGSIELARQGILEPHACPAAADIPAAWRDSQNRWVGLAARARVLAFNPQRVKREELPTTWQELADPRWAKRLALANPQFGTTRGHLAAMLATWGADPTYKFLQALRDGGSQIADGNSHAVRLVLSGAADICMTDTDDVWVAQQRGQPIDLTYPRLSPNGPVVWIPCTVGRIRGGPNPAAASKLIDFLVSAEAERALAESDSRNVPVRLKLREELHVSGPAPEPLDFERIADVLPEAARLAGDILLK